MRHDTLFMAHVNHMLFMARPYIRPGSKISTGRSWKNSGLADAIVVTWYARYGQGRRGEQGLQSTHSWRMTQQNRIMAHQNDAAESYNGASEWRNSIKGVNTYMSRQRAFEAVKGKALWVMSESNQGSSSSELYSAIGKCYPLLPSWVGLSSSLDGRWVGDCFFEVVYWRGFDDFVW